MILCLQVQPEEVDLRGEEGEADRAAERSQLLWRRRRGGRGLSSICFFNFVLVFLILRERLRKLFLGIKVFQWHKNSVWSEIFLDYDGDSRL